MLEGGRNVATGAAWATLLPGTVGCPREPQGIALPPFLRTGPRRAPLHPTEPP